MSHLFFDPLLGFVPVGDEHEPWTALVDPTVERELERDRWHARAAQWRARALAEWVFEGEVEASLTGHATSGPLRGLLHLRVPFAGLAEHRAREARFLAIAQRDPVLGSTPFVYVFAAGAPRRPKPAEREA